MKLLRYTINSLFVFILFLIIIGGFVLHLKNPYEISAINLFVIILWALIGIYFLLRKYFSPSLPVEDLMPFQMTDFLIRISEEFPLKKLLKLSLILAGVFASILIVCSVFKYFSFNSYMWDLGFFDNLLWNTSQGNFYRVSTTFKTYQNVLGDHLHPIILLFLPFYKIYPSPVWFLFFQPIIVAIGAIGVFRLGRAILKDQALSFVIFLAFLMYLPVRRGVLFDFHESSFFPFVFIWMYVYYFEKQYKKAFLLFILSFAVKETAALYNSIFLFSILFSDESQKHKIISVVLAIISFSIFLIEITILIPYFRGGTPYEYYEIYRTIGRSPAGIVHFVFTKPYSFLRHVFQKAKFIFTVKVLAPLAFFPVFSLRGCMIVAAPLLILILSDDPRRYDTRFSYHYGLDLAAFVFLSAILGLKHLRYRFPNLNKRFVFFLIFWLSLAFYDKSEIMRIRSFLPSKEDIQLHDILVNIPKDKTIRATSNFVPHFSQRNNFQEALPLKPEPENEDFYVIPSIYLNKPTVQKALKEQNYRLFHWNSKVSIFEKVNSSGR
jgi:uncharacterized membrane protein